jgi:hypothetical protein
MTRKPFIILVALLIAFTSRGYTQTNAALNSRLDQFIKATSTFDVDRCLDLTYPRLYEFAPRSQMKKALQSVFENEMLNMSIDSAAVDKVSPVFVFKNGQYAKVTYSFVMRMGFKSDTAGLVMAKKVLPAMKKTYGTANVRIDEQHGGLAINRSSAMAAIKNSYSKDWTFIEIKEDDPLTDKLLGKELLTKFQQY